MDEKLFVGFDRQEVAPDEPIPLGGYGNEPNRFHDNVLQPICVTAVAVSDSSDTTILMVALDAVRVNDYLAGEGLERISKAVGVPKDRIYMSASHSHAAPSLKVADQFPCMARYAEKYLQKIIEACHNALADRKESDMFVGSIETKNVNFIKHYKAVHKVTGAIAYIGDQFGDHVNNAYVEHATVVDPTMHVLQFTRQNAKPVVVTNFRAHPHFDGGGARHDLSADYIGCFRDALESVVDCHAVFFQGACGNVNSSTRLPAERHYATAASYGLGLAGFAAECLAKYMRPAAAGPIRTKQQVFYGEINRPSEALKAKAEEVRQIWYSTFNRAKCVEVGVPGGIRSPYHAIAIHNNANFTAEDGKMILNAVAIGDEFAFTTFPGELYDSVSARMEDNSPFATTMMLGYCYHHVGYLPSAVGYKYTSYETDITRFAPGTGEIMADTQVEMLRSIK